MIAVVVETAKRTAGERTAVCLIYSAHAWVRSVSEVY
jgi:hypothetical protein